MEEMVDSKTCAMRTSCTTTPGAHRKCRSDVGKGRVFSTYDGILSLALPEHHVRLTRDTQRTKVNAAWGLFSLLELNIICDNYVCE